VIFWVPRYDLLDNGGLVPHFLLSYIKTIPGLSGVSDGPGRRHADRYA